MGLFSGTRTFVATQVQRVIEDKMLPDCVQTGLMTALLGNNGRGVPEEIVESILHSIGLKAEQYYDHVEKGNYVFGSPSGDMRSLSRSKAMLQTILDGIEGETISIDYVRLGSGNLFHQAWMQLVSDFGYDPTTNQLATFSAELGTEVFLDDMIINVPERKLDGYLPGVLDLIGDPANAGATPARDNINDQIAQFRKPTPVKVGSGTGWEEFITLKLAYLRTEDEGTGDNVIPKGTLKIESRDFPLKFALDSEKTYYQVKYTTSVTSKWWSYETGTGIYPNLDQEADAPYSDSGSYFPFLYFRYEKEAGNKDKNSDEYHSSKNLANIIGMDYDQIADAIGENPDIDDVTQAMMIFAVPPDSESEVEREYLFKYFAQLYSSQDFVFQSPNRIIESGKNPWDISVTDGQNAVVVDIQDKRFRMQLRARAIYKQYKNGTIGKVGEYSSSKTEVEYEGTFIGGDESTYTRVIKVPSHAFQHQVTEHLYEEVRVVGLETSYLIFGNFATLSNDDENILMVPVDRSLVKDWQIPKKEKLYSRALHYVFNSVTVVELAWYQTGFFQILIVIVAAVIAYFTGGSASGLLAEAIAAGGSAVAAVVLIDTFLSFLISLAVGQLVTIFAKAIGADATLIAAFAIVIAVISGVSFKGLPTSPTAMQMLSVANNLVSAGFAQKTEDLMDEWKDFQDFAEGQQELLDNANALLDQQHRLNPLIIFGESPDDFYNRTVHSGNVGALSIASVSSFVDNALELPRISEFLGDSLPSQYT